jgi:hypothetical protein
MGAWPEQKGEKMARLGRIGIAAAAWLVIASASAALASEVGCEGFALGYDGDAAIRKCSEARIVNGMSAVNVQQAVFADHSFVIVIVYAKSEGRTYLPMRTLSELVEDGKLFSQATAWKPARSLHGFDVAAFSGVLSGQSEVLECAIFSRFGGNPGNYEFDAGPGYSKHLTGYYCATPGFLTTAQKGDGFYGLVEGALGRMRLPPAD